MTNKVTVETKEGQPYKVFPSSPKHVSPWYNFQVFFEYESEVVAKNAGIPDITIPLTKVDSIRILTRQTTPQSDMVEALALIFEDRTIVNVWEPIRICNCTCK